MDYSRPLLADRLAAGYVAGTLRGRARRRFEALLPAHPSLRGAVTEWQDRLIPLTVSIAPQQPPARVWQGIERRIGGRPANESVAQTTSQGWWRQLAFWRGLTALGAVAVVSLSVLLASPGPATPPIVVVLNAPAPAPGAPAITPASFVASISGDGRAMVTRPITNVSVQSDRSLELWAIQGSLPPRSLGVISAQGATVVRRGKVLEGADTLAVTLEQTGGSPDGKPKGPVVFVGKLQS